MILRALEWESDQIRGLGTAPTKKTSRPSFIVYDFATEFEAITPKTMARILIQFESSKYTYIGRIAKTNNVNLHNDDTLRKHPHTRFLDTVTPRISRLSRGSYHTWPEKTETHFSQTITYSTST